MVREDPQFKETVDEILNKHTNYSSIDDMDKFDMVEIDSGSSVIMDLVVERNGSSEVTIAQYVDGDARKPDPMVKFDYPSFEPTYMEDTMQKESDPKHIKDFLQMWGSNLQNQFL